MFLLSSLPSSRTHSLWQLEETETILERGAFAADEKDIMLHPLVRTTEAFLVKHLRLESSVGSGGNGGSSGGGKGGKGGKGKSGRSSGAGAQSASSGTLAAEDEVAPYVTLLISLSGGESNTDDCRFT